MVHAQAVGIDDGFHCLRTGINAGGHQLILLGDRHNFSHTISPVTRRNRRCLVRPSRWTCRAFAFAGFSHRKKIRIRLLNFRDALRRLYRPLQPFIVKTVRGGAGGLAIKRHTDRRCFIHLRHVLVNGVIGKARKREIDRGEDNFDFVDS